MATASRIDSMDAVNNGHHSVVGGPRDGDIQCCLERLLALG